MHTPSFVVVSRVAKSSDVKAALVAAQVPSMAKDFNDEISILALTCCSRRKCRGCFFNGGENELHASQDALQRVCEEIERTVGCRIGNFLLPPAPNHWLRPRWK